ncbi:MAG: hypothetical protein HeimC2_20120 [Candidatus Heimdallarchaeota archaeon LC_2]|nr:MAG: hypothetical protein HeimC2_20120 [Candidatus Heimdallarchaeota archaeon LC_2]
MYDHLKPENVASKKQLIKELNKNNGSTQVKAIIVGVIIIVALAFGGVFSGELGSINPNDNNDQSIIPNNGEAKDFTYLKDVWLDGHNDIGLHYHFFISFLIFDESKGLAADIGVYGSRMKPIHTHDSSGKVHLELPSNYGRIPTLADFFAIWSDWAGETIGLSRNTLLGETGSVLLSSNCNIVFTGDLGGYELVQHPEGDELLVISIDP